MYTRGDWEMPHLDTTNCQFISLITLLHKRTIAKLEALKALHTHPPICLLHGRYLNGQSQPLLFLFVYLDFHDQFNVTTRPGDGGTAIYGLYRYVLL